MGSSQGTRKDSSQSTRTGSSQGTRMRSSQQGTRQDSSQSVRKDLASALDRVAVVLIGVYILLFIAAVMPPLIKDPRWATGILDSLRAVAFLPLIGAVLILLANHMDSRSKIISKHRKWVQKFAPLAALGFFLLIPLQGLANYNVIRTAKIEAMQKIIKLTRAMTMIRTAQDEIALRSGINQIGIQNLPQGKLTAPIETVKEQLLSQIAPEISKIQYQTERRNSQVLQGLIFQWIRDGAVALLYGIGFRGLNIRSEVFTKTPFGAFNKFSNRRWK